MTAPTPEDKLRLGGMALRNGLLVHGPSMWAAACRRSDGTIGVISGAKPRVRGVEDVPGLRGIVRLGEAVAVIPLAKRALPEIRLPFADGRVLGSAVVVSLAVRALRAGGRGGGLGTEVGAAALSLAPSLIALRSGELAAYHGVEHKAIAAYERDDPDAAQAAKEHDRCGSHLMAPLLTANLAGRGVAAPRRRRAGAGPPGAGRPGLHRRGGGGLRVGRAPPRQPAHPRAAHPRPRAPAGGRHA